MFVAHAHDEAVAGDPGVVDEDGHGAERALDLAEGRVDGVGIGNVGLHHDRFAAGLFDHLSRLARTLGVGGVAEADGMAGSREREHDLTSDTA